MRKLLRLDPVLTSDKIHCKGVEALWQRFFPYLIRERIAVSVFIRKWNLENTYW